MHEDPPFETGDPAFTLEFRPQQPPPPPTMVLRRNKQQVPLVISEDEGFELYLVLKAHFEPGGGDGNK